MTPLTYYRQKLHHGFIVEDQQQLIAIAHLQIIYDKLLVEHKNRSKLLSSLRKPKSIQGLYLWGGVGIGKTFLMDCFYHCLPFKEKMRMHFHQFMQMVHVELKKHQGKRDPLQLIAKEIAKKCMVLCFDELFVNDITDAMILGRLFQALIVNGVCLIATSNAKPDDLYKHGLQRKQFLPAIELLKRNTTVLYISTAIDYRLRYLKNAGVFHIPNDDAANVNMEKTFEVLAGDTDIGYKPVEICGRHIPIKKQAGHEIIWFDFDIICNIPRSQHDYLEIAKLYKTVFISDVPTLSPNAKNVATLFIKLVDVFYDAHVRLILSAEDKIEKIYRQGPMSFEFARTCSRLLEMQSEKYFLRI